LTNYFLIKDRCSAISQAIIYCTALLLRQWVLFIYKLFTMVYWYVHSNVTRKAVKNKAWKRIKALNWNSFKELRLGIEAVKRNCELKLVEKELWIEL
jgi:hypothetical protein